MFCRCNVNPRNIKWLVTLLFTKLEVCLIDIFKSMIILYVRKFVSVAAHKLFSGEKVVGLRLVAIHRTI